MANSVGAVLVAALCGQVQAWEAGSGHQASPLRQLRREPVPLLSTGFQGPFCLHLCVHRTREDIGSTELESQAVVSCPLWVLGTVAGPLGRAARPFPSQSSLQPLGCLLKEQNPELSTALSPSVLGRLFEQGGRRDIYT